MIEPEIAEVVAAIIRAYSPIMTTKIYCGYMMVCKSINQIAVAGQVNLGLAHTMTVQIAEIQRQTTVIGRHAFLFKQI